MADQMPEKGRLLNAPGFHFGEAWGKMVGIMGLVAILNLILCWPDCAASGIGTSDYQNTSSVTKPRVAIGILVDVSRHQTKVIDFEREVVNSLFRQFTSMNVETFVMGYSWQVKLLQDWSPVDVGSDMQPVIELNHGIGKREQTLLYNALDAGLAKLDSKTDFSPKVLIVIGEGNDSGSNTKFSEIKKRAQSAHVQCFSLLVADHNLMGGRVRHFGFNLYILAGATKGAGYDIETSHKRLDKAVTSLLKKITTSDTDK